MADSYLDRINKILSKPIIPQKPEEEKYDKPIFFPDADATAKEVAEFLNEADVAFLKDISEEEIGDN